MRESISPPPSRKRKRRRTNEVEASWRESENDNVSTTTTIPPNPQHLRIYAWNINGVSPFIQPAITSFLRKPAHSSSPSTTPPPDQPPVIQTSLRNFLQRHHWPQLFFLQEVKINPSDTATQRAVTRAINHCPSVPSGPSYQTHFNLPSDRCNASAFRGKIYGVLAAIRSDFAAAHVAAVRQLPWDAEGRVLCIETRATPTAPPLAIFNIYAVNGTDRPHRDARGAVRGTRHGHKLAFHAALLDECRRAERRGFGVVLAGDFNVAREPRDGHPKLRTTPEQHARNRADFNDKFFWAEDGLRATDAFRLCRGDARKFSWHPRGRGWMDSCDRVDLVIAGRSVVDAGMVRDCDVLETKEERGPSDHVPIYVELDVGLPPPSEELR